VDASSGNGDFPFVHRSRRFVFLHRRPPFEKTFFMACHRLSTVIFKAGFAISDLGDSSFSLCTSLQSICIPSSVGVIGLACFFASEQLSVIAPS
jgi:hypothetical protein